MPDSLVDSSVLLDVLTEDEDWFEWSSRELARWSDEGALIINPIVYAEVSIRFRRIEDLDEVLGSDFERRPLPWSAGFLAGKAFVEYRRRGGGRGSPLPDFYIGAHAAVEGLTLITRDPTRYRHYFPRVDLITPGR